MQIGTLRFDLDILASQLPKPEKKKAKALTQTFFKQASPPQQAPLETEAASSFCGMEKQVVVPSVRNLLGLVMHTQPL